MRCFDWDSAGNWNTGLWVWQGPLLLLHSVTSSEGLSSLPRGLPLRRGLNHSRPTNPPCSLYAGHGNQNLNIFLHNLKTKSHYTCPSKFSAFLSKTQQTMMLTFHFHTHTHTHYQISVWSEIKANLKVSFFFQCYRTTESQNFWGKKALLRVILSNLLCSSSATQGWLPRNLSRWL